MPGQSIKIADLTAAAAAGKWYPFPAGTATIVVKGTFDGGTVTIQASDDEGTTALSLGSNADFTEAAARTIELGEGMQIRASVAGGGGSEDLDVYLRPLKGRAI